MARIAKGENPNAPKKDDKISVQAITELKDIKGIKRDLAELPRDFCLFVLGINTNLRASDLVALTIGQVRGKKVDDDLVLYEKKTGKERRITLNQSTIEAIDGLLKARKGAADAKEPLFLSQRGGKALTVPSVTRLVKTWCSDRNMKGNYGSHTLRKTFGYHQRMAGTDIPTLMDLFNHSTQRQTLAYLGIQAEEKRSAYHRVNL